MSKPTITLTDTPQAAADYAAETINQCLHSGKRVLVLLPGGSSIQVAAAAHRKLDADKLSQVTLTLTDERYGEVNHPDSNWRQLAEAGLEIAADERSIPVLTGKPMDQTIREWATALQQAIEEHDVTFGFFGMGADGHTCGILPGSPAVESKEYVAGYNAETFLRITMTPVAVKNVDAGILYVMGENKRPALEDLANDLPLSLQPAQILKQLPSLAVFTDIQGITL